MASDVKRKYRSSRRRTSGAQTRVTILEAAKDRFLAGGYSATTMNGIAQAADVSVETVYKAFGNKARLAKAVFDHAITGDDPISAGERATEVSINEQDPRARLRAFGRFVTEVTPRVAPLMLIVRTAAEADADVNAVYQEMVDERLASMSRHAQRLHDDGHLRAEVSVEEARDVMWTFCSPELYDLLVVQRGWSPERLGTWVGDAYIAALL